MRDLTAVVLTDTVLLMCPHWDRLHRIFSDRPPTTPCNILHSSQVFNQTNTLSIMTNHSPGKSKRQEMSHNYSIIMGNAMNCLQV